MNRHKFQRLLFPGSLLLTVFGASVALSSELPPEFLPLAAVVASFVVVLVAERVFPRVGKPGEAGELRTDLWFVALTAGGDVLIRALLAALLVGFTRWQPAGWCSSLPLWVGAPGVLLIGGLGDYWAHRLGHEWEWCWKMHAVHHAPRRMVALNNLRLHPLDLAMKLSFAVVPVVLLGFSAEAIAMAGAVQGLTAAFQHADIDLRHGAFNRVFATNSVHRWHHSARADEANANYGGVLSVFDLLFGTYHVPSEELDPERMGLFEEKCYPVHAVTRSIVAPLCWRRCVDEGPDRVVRRQLP